MPFPLIGTRSHNQDLQLVPEKRVSSHNRRRFVEIEQKKILSHTVWWAIHFFCSFSLVEEVELKKLVFLLSTLLTHQHPSIYHRCFATRACTPWPGTPPPSQIGDDSARAGAAVCGVVPLYASAIGR